MPVVRRDRLTVLSVVLTAGILLGSMLVLIHARHLPGTTQHGAGSTTWGWTPHGENPGTYHGIPNRNPIDCPAPKWCDPPRLEHDGTTPDAADVLEWLHPAEGSGSLVFTPLRTPVARGPDLQAILQRFTL